MASQPTRYLAGLLAESLEIIGFDGGTLVECCRSVPVVSDGQGRCAKLLVGPGRKGQVWDREVDVRRYAEEGRVTLLEAPLPIPEAVTGASPEDGERQPLVVFANQAFLTEADVQLPEAYAGEPFVWRPCQGQPTTWAACASKEATLRLLDAWGEGLLAKARAALAEDDPGAPERARRLADLGLCAAEGPALRWQLYLCYGAAQSGGATPEKVRELYDLFIARASPKKTWEEYSREMDSLLREVRPPSPSGHEKSGPASSPSNNHPLTRRLMAEKDGPTEAPASKADKVTPHERTIRVGLYAIAACCVLAAIAHTIWPDRVDQTTAMFLGLAAVVLIIREISKIEFPGGKIERVRQELKKEVRQVDRKVEVIEEAALLPGRSQSERPLAPVPRRAAAPSAAGKPKRKAPGGKQGPDPDDPNKTNFGGAAAANGRVLEAEIDPVSGERSAACRVHFWVRSTDLARPLTGKVTFHLHPTFNRWAKYDVDAENGVAEDTIVSWGAFTIGAEADLGKTKLELDLENVKGGTRKFYAQ